MNVIEHRKTSLKDTSKKLTEEESRELAKAHAKVTAEKAKRAMIKSIMAAFVLTSGLAWRDAINKTIDAYFPEKKKGLPLKYAYAFGLTTIVVILSVFVFKID